MIYDLVIVGGGVAGYAAAIYAGRFHLKTLVLSENQGGAIVLTDSVENYPGFKKISGQGLFDAIKSHALEYNIETCECRADRIEKKGELFEIFNADKHFQAMAVIIATGTEWKKLNVPGELELSGNGVHYCALCDGYAYQDKVISVVGGSDSAVKEALLLSQYAKKVYIIYRKCDIRAEPINITRVNESLNIEVIPETNVVGIKGSSTVQSVILDKEYNGSNELKLDGVFIAIGHVPISQLFKNLGVEMTSTGAIVTNKYGETNVPGIYAAGDVTDNRFKQAITGVSEGVSAVYCAYQYLKSKTIKTQ
jgi:thioredoxin reductase (NADPH)